jgi:hypothetical protein
MAPRQLLAMAPRQLLAMAPRQLPVTTAADAIAMAPRQLLATAAADAIAMAPRQLPVTAVELLSLADLVELLLNVDPAGVLPHHHEVVANYTVLVAIFSRLGD